MGEYSQNVMSEAFRTPNIASSQFEEDPKLEKFSQLRTDYDRGFFFVFFIGSTNNPSYVREADVCPVKNGL